MKMTKMIALTIPIVLLLMSFARPAAAMKPEMTVIPYHDEGSFDCSTLNPEWAFQFAYIDDGEITITTHFDNNGDPDWIMFQGGYHGTAWNTVSGVATKDSQKVTELWDLKTNEMKWSGYLVIWTIPGKGIVFHDSGHQVFQLDSEGSWNRVWSAGHHDFFDGYDEGGIEHVLSAYCAALA